MLLLFACHPDPDGAPLGGAPLWQDPDGASVWVGEDGVVRHVVHAQEREVRLSLGFVAAPDDAVNYDPWNLYDPAVDLPLPPGLAFSAVSEALWTGDSYALRLENGASATLAVNDAGPGLRFTVAQGEAPWAPYVRVSVAVEEDETFYGLGEIFSEVQHRGSVHAMQMELDPAFEAANNEAHVPVPLLISNASWGVLADSYWPGAFDVAAMDPERVDITYNHDGAFTFDLYAPPTPPEVTARYHQRTGAPEIPPTWAFAPLQWRNALAGENVVREDAAAIRALGIPTGLIWMDNPWQTTYNSMEHDPELFPAWDDLVADLHGAGFRVMAWSTPYLEEADPDYSAYESAGWFVDAPLLINQFGPWVDLTHPDAMAAWQDRVDGGIAQGIEGWKLDYGEDAQIVGTNRLQYAFANGEDERTMHHKYAAFFAHAYADPYVDHEGFILARAGTLGGHTVTDCIWPGDLDSDFRTFGDEDGDGTHVGGLPSAIRAGTGLSVSGYPFFASDTGGYRHGRPTSETMIRWTEYSAMLPIMQYGGGGENHNAWDFTDYGTSQFDQTTLDAFVRYTQLHIRLFPYFWRLAERARDEGLPTLLPLGLSWIGAGIDPDNVFLVGDDLLVAPVEVEGATGRSVPIPPGGWVHWWTGTRYDGDAIVDVAAPLGFGPVFQREGSAIPMLRRSVVTLSPATDGTDSWADDPGMLNARVIPGAGAGFALSTGEAMAVEADGVALTTGSLYSGWDVEIWAPGATGATVDGVAVASGGEGCVECVHEGDPFLRVVTRSGTSIRIVP